MDHGLIHTADVIAIVVVFLRIHIVVQISSEWQNAEQMLLLAFYYCMLQLLIPFILCGLDLQFMFSFARSIEPDNNGDLG